MKVTALLPPSLTRLWSPGLKRGVIVALALVSISLIGWRLDALSAELDIKHLWIQWRQGWGYLLAALLLMPLNILLEGVKWRIAARTLLDLPTGRAVGAVLRGVALSYPLTTTLGEHTSRLALFPRELLARAVPVSIFCGASQFLASGTGLTVGLSLLGDSIGPWARLIPASWGLALICWVGFLAFPTIWRVSAGTLSTRFPFLLQPMPQMPTSTGLSLALLSLVRYGVYLGQYLLLLIGSGALVSGQDVAGMAARLTLIFGVKALVPLFSFVGMAPLRELLALELLMPTGAPPLSILAGGLLLWVVNQGLTGLAGVTILLRYGRQSPVETTL